MPIYEYECDVCGSRHEILQKFSDAPLRDCPDCGKPELVKLVSAAGFRLAGSGWYETDFKTGNKRNLAGGTEAKGKTSTAQSDKSDKSSGQSGKTDKGTATKPAGKGTSSGV